MGASGTEAKQKGKDQCKEVDEVDQRDEKLEAEGTCW